VVILKLTLIISLSVIAYSILFLRLNSYSRKRLLESMFPHVNSEGELSKPESDQLNKAHHKNHSTPLMNILGYAYLIMNIPGVALCSTVYRMDKEGASGYIVMIASAIAYFMIIPFGYFAWLARVSH
jgi:hypothetical protein